MSENLMACRTCRPDPPAQPDVQVEPGDLLVRITVTNPRHCASEVGQVDCILSYSFNLNPLDAANLPAKCETLARAAPGTPEFAALQCKEISYGTPGALAKSNPDRGVCRRRLGRQRRGHVALDRCRTRALRSG